MLPSFAALFLLGGLQPALGQTTECSSNKLLMKQITPHEVIMGYNAQNTGCDAGVRAWVGVWDADASLKHNFKTWKYLEANEGEVRFTKNELGPGEWKASFVCEDGWRIPFLSSGRFELGTGIPAAKPGECVYRFNANSAEWYTRPCDKVSDLCYDCGFTASCGACTTCKKQCGQE